MQFFNDEEDVFLPKLPEGIFDMDKEIFSIGSEIKKRLGEEGYLIDNYLLIILEWIRENAIQNAFFDSENAFSGMHKLISDIRTSKDVYDEDIRKHPLYPQVKENVDKYLTKYKSPYTPIAMARIAVMPFVMKKLYEENQTMYSSMGRIDTVRLEELYDQMCPYTGENLLNQLSKMVKTQFIITSAISVYMQSVTDQYLDILLQRDEVTSKQYFQLMLDEFQEEV